MTVQLLTTFLCALGIALLVVPLVRRVALRLRIGAPPGGRSVHKVFTPVMGGLGILAGMTGGCLVCMLIWPETTAIFANYKHFWFGLIAIVLTGMIDDFRGVSPIQKFGGQLVAAILAVYGGCFIESFYSPGGAMLNLGMLSLPFSVLWIVFVINAVNLMDGLDGLAAGVATIVGSGFLLLAIYSGNLLLALICIALIGGLAGFLRYNYRPASIFMGDTGSLMLGYIMAILSIETLKISGTHNVYFLASLVLLGMPLTDTLISFFRRMARGDHPFKPDRDHIHHRLTRLSLSHIDTVWLMYYFTLLLTALGLLMVVYREFAGTALFLLALGFAIYWAWRLGYVETRHYVSFGTDEHETEAAMRPPIHVNRIWHRLLIFTGDLFALGAAFYLTHWFRFYSGLVNRGGPRSLMEYLADPVFLLYIGFWLLLFWLNGAYALRWDKSRFDIVLRMTKVLTFGIVSILLVLNIDLILGNRLRDPLNQNQLKTLGFHWLALVVLVNGVRLLIIRVEKSFHIFEYTFKNTLLIGTTRKARQVIRDVAGNPHLIYNFVGIVERKPRCETFEGLPVLGTYGDLPQLIHEHQVEEIIVALGEKGREDLMNIVGICDRMQVVVKTVPALQNIVAGHNPGLAGHGLMQVFPETMVLWQWALKRIIDIVSSLAGLIVLLPVWIPIVIAIIIKREGGLFVKLPMLGKNGRVYNLYLLRLHEDDDISKNSYRMGWHLPDFDRFGYVLFRTQFYKLPNLFNVLRGDMSLVGPRPEAPEWYKDHQRRLSFLHRRLMVRPGITGIAQYKFRFDLSQHDISERVKFDLYYVENLSLNLDVRIMIRSLLLLFRKAAG